jgi:hypothetical protein
MLEDAYETVAMPGKYCDPMAYVLDNSLAACDADDELSLGLGGDYYARYGKFVLHIDDRGFVESWSFKSKVLAGVEMELLRHDWRDEDDDEGEENDPLGPLEA